MTSSYDTATPSKNRGRFLGKKMAYQTYKPHNGKDLMSQHDWTHPVARLGLPCQAQSLLHVLSSGQRLSAVRWNGLPLWMPCTSALIKRQISLVDVASLGKLDPALNQDIILRITCKRDVRFSTRSIRVVRCPNSGIWLENEREDVVPFASRAPRSQC